MKTFITVILFSVGIIFIYALFANGYIPQIQPAPPPVEAKLDMGNLTMEQFVEMGDKIFQGKGTCILCHNPVGGRAPQLGEIASKAEERIKDPRYKGKAKTGEEYIRESMMEPSAFVVQGFGAAGTNDTQSPMPVISGGAIGLKPYEIDAVIAYFQNKAGVTITVQLPKEAPAASSEGAASAGPARTAEDIVNKYGCGACHKIAGQLGALGPDLTKIGSKKNRDYLRKSIINPNADIASGFPPGMMPPDFADKMFVSEIEIMLDYMTKSK